MCGILGLLVKNAGKIGNVRRGTHKTAFKKIIGSTILKQLRTPKTSQLHGKSYASILRALKTANQASITLMSPEVFVNVYEDIAFQEKLRAEARRFLVMAEDIQQKLDGTSVANTSVANTSVADTSVADTGKKRSVVELEHLNYAGIVCRDIAWRIEKDFLFNIEKVRNLISGSFDSNKLFSKKIVREGWKLNIILNNLDRLEVRGRDSAGLTSVIAFKDRAAYTSFERALKKNNLDAEFRRRLQVKHLVNHAIVQHKTSKHPTLVMTHKLAEEIGPLGYNVRQLRENIASDVIFQV